MLKIDPDKFDSVNQLSTYQAFRTFIDCEPIPDPPKKLFGRRQPSHLLDIQLQYFIEMINAEHNPDTFEGFEMVAACFYRKNWKKDFDAEELLKTANIFQKKPLIYSIHGINLFNQLIQLLRDTYPNLYDSETNSNDVEEGRKLYDMLNGLSKDDPNKWEESGNLPLSTAFAYLEEKKKEYIKQKHNAQR